MNKLEQESVAEFHELKYGITDSLVLANILSTRIFARSQWQRNVPADSSNWQHGTDE